jgi:hypothetical protein
LITRQKNLLDQEKDSKPDQGVRLLIADESVSASAEFSLIFGIVWLAGINNLA